MYRSSNPLCFGIDDDAKLVCSLPVAAPEILHHRGKYYIAALNPGLDGIRIARLKRQRFGASSEKIEREIEQLELALEDLKVEIASTEPTPAHSSWSD